MKTSLLATLAGLATLGLTSSQRPAADKGLKDYYKDYFPVGVAVSGRSVSDPAESAFILQQFNSLTPENDMKMGPIHPEENRWNWGPADAIVDFAQAHKLRVRGHNLCWHEQTPSWLFKNADGKPGEQNCAAQAPARPHRRGGEALQGQDLRLGRGE